MNILIAFGTRPELIKLTPLIKEMSKLPHIFKLTTVATAQHRELLDDLLTSFKLTPDYDLNIMRPGQSITHITTTILAGFERIFQECRPDLVIVQGDTTSAFASALAAFYHKIPVGHIEAGLRSGDFYNPFPEERNRTIISKLATYHFAPTVLCKQNLLNEGVPQEKIFVTGNTAIDALLDAQNNNGAPVPAWLQEIIEWPGRNVLVTAHRQESLGKPLVSICKAIRELVNRFNDIQIVFPLHLNPNVRETILSELTGVNRVKLIEPVSYTLFLELMKSSYLILTDSGGLQEEAPSLGKPVVIMRNVTDRPESVKAGIAQVCGTKSEDIVSITERILSDPDLYETMAPKFNPFGDGQAASRIVNILIELKNAGGVRCSGSASWPQ